MKSRHQPVVPVIEAAHGAHRRGRASSGNRSGYLPVKDLARPVKTPHRGDALRWNRAMSDADRSTERRRLSDARRAGFPNAHERTGPGHPNDPPRPLGQRRPSRSRSDRGSKESPRSTTRTADPRKPGCEQDLPVAQPSFNAETSDPERKEFE